jgi:hypothetical protein
MKGRIMTIEEYMDPARFPATTREELMPKRQLLIDADKYDELQRSLEDGGELDENQKCRWAELQVKMKHNAIPAAKLAQTEHEQRP